MKEEQISADDVNDVDLENDANAFFIGDVLTQSRFDGDDVTDVSLDIDTDVSLDVDGVV